MDRAVHNLEGSSVIVACVVGFHEGTQSLKEKTTYDNMPSEAQATLMTFQ